MMKTTLLVLVLGLSNFLVSQNFILNSNVDSLKCDFFDTIYRITNDYSTSFYIRKDENFIRDRLYVHILNNENREVVKVYDLETMTNIVTISYLRLNDKIYHDGEYYYYDLNTKSTTRGFYKMNYLNGIITTRDSIGNLSYKSICNAKAMKCKCVEFYSNGEIKKQYNLLANTLYDGEYVEYYELNRQIKTVGKYKSHKVSKKKGFELISKTKSKSLQMLSDNLGVISWKIGKWVYCSEDGVLTKEEIYDKYGNLIEKKEFKVDNYVN